MTNLESQQYIVTYNPTTFLLTIFALNQFLLNFNISFSCAKLLEFKENNTSNNVTFTEIKAINL